MPDQARRPAQGVTQDVMEGFQKIRVMPVDADDKVAMAVASETRSRSARRSFSQQMSAIGARLTLALSTEGRDTASVSEALVNKPDTPTDYESRSVSRGRDAFQSSGRGGIGNIRCSSQSRDARPAGSPEDISHTRGREPAIHPDRIFSVGRGGAGNIRSPSQGPHPIPQDVAEAEYQAKLVREHAEATTIHSSGRGGAGNISGSRSRSRGPATVMHSTGRGGAGNIHAGNNVGPDVLDEEERKQHAHHEVIHSTGRGGAANITITHGPDIEHVTHHPGEYESTGRGGAGNIRSRSGSRDPAVRAASKEKHGIAAVFDKLSHPHQHHHVRAHDHPDGSPNEGAADRLSIN